MSEPTPPGGRRPAVTRIAAVRPSQRVTVTGTIRAAAAEAIGTSRGLRCVIGDGSGEIDMVFLGRERVAGLAPRRRCMAEGMACVYGERLVIWNPRYTLQPAGAGDGGGRPPPRPGAPAGRALVIGDDPGMRRVIEVNLTSRGYQVDVAATPVAATSPGLRDAGLIIVDIGVAKAAGLKTISALREASAVPILTISALGGEGMARDCASVGSDDFLAKPFPIGVLVGKVARHLAAVGAADPA